MKKDLLFSPDAIIRINSLLKKKNLSDKDLDKNLKKSFYEIHSNYFKGFNYAKALELLKKSKSLSVHEKLLKKYDPNRFIILNELYDKIFQITGKPKVLVDLACGLNPLTMPWMNLGNDSKYYCYDLEKGLIDFLNNYFDLMNKKNYEAILCDVLSNPSSIKCDVAFLFKASTCFEWQSPKSTSQLLKKINANYLVISVMLRGEKNIAGCRNYLNSILGDFLKGLETHEIVLKKEYFLAVKINKGLRH